MKKNLILAFAILYCLASAFAADYDLIIKTNSESIEALIQEVSKNEIHYKKANNPNGPTFVLTTDEVSAIVYANGEVQSIEHKTRPADNNNQYDYSVESQPVGGLIKRTEGNSYIVNDKVLEGKVLELFLLQNCPKAYTYYKKKKAIETAGYCLLGVGIPLCTGVGVGLFCASSSYRYYGTSKWEETRNDPVALTGLFFMVFGGAMTLASVPMIACGNVGKKRVDEVYNVHCGAPSTVFRPELKFTAGANGLGLALSF